MNIAERLAFWGYLIIGVLIFFRSGEAAAIHWLTFGIFLGIYAILEELRSESRRTRKLVRASAARARADDTSASE